MNNLTKKTYARAWAACFVERRDGSKLALGELREAYERDTRFICFLPHERDLIRQGLFDACTDFLGAVPLGLADATDNTVLEGIGFRTRKKMAGKPELWIESQTTINTNSGFNHKGGLSTVGAANKEVDCPINCLYCSSEKVMERTPSTTILRVLGLRHGDVVIRKLDALATARKQLTFPDGSPRYNDPNDHRILETASIVDALGTKELAEETYQLVRMVFELTGWRVRVLTKSNLLAKFARRFNDEERQRLLLGFSYGTPDDDLARVVERGAALPSERRAQHNELLGEEFLMFGMPCPVFPSRDYRVLAETIATHLQVDRLEKVWVEVMNSRGDSMIKTINAVQKDYPDLANQLARFRSSQSLWEIEYNRAVFLAFAEVVPPGKLPYLTYVTPESESWWSEHVSRGAILL
jgi:DNA repair photolyase